MRSNCLATYGAKSRRGAVAGRPKCLAVGTGKAATHKIDSAADRGAASASGGQNAPHKHGAVEQTALIQSNCWAGCENSETPDRRTTDNGTIQKRRSLRRPKSVERSGARVLFIGCAEELWGLPYNAITNYYPAGTYSSARRHSKKYLFNNSLLIGFNFSNSK